MSQGRAVEEALSPVEPPAPAEAPATASDTGPPGGLTHREREVAVLIARGYSNPRIGAELVVSRRTVEAHVTAILTKLGLASRTEIAVWAVEHGLRPAAPT